MTASTAPRRPAAPKPPVAPKVPAPWVAIHHATLTATLSELNRLRSQLVAAVVLERTLRDEVSVAWRDCDLAIRRQTRLTAVAFGLAFLLLSVLIVAVS